MAALNNLFHYLIPTNLVTSLHLHQRRRISVRHVLLTLGISAILSTLYYTYLNRGHVFISSERWSHETPQVWAKRAAQVKEAFRHAYHGYEQHAFPRDELTPVSNNGTNNFNGWGVTVVDSLDTMLLMGLEDEYTRALPMISDINFAMPHNVYVPFFETIIRYLGGLLGAYAMSGHDVLLEKADELGTALSPAFSATSGFPGFAVDTYGKSNLSFSTGVLAEIASWQMEYTYLGKMTGKKEHVDHATTITNHFYNANLSESGGMYPTRWDLKKGSPMKVHLTVGALADSGHEYTLKQFLMTARTDKRNLEMYLRLTSYVINNLLYISPKRRLLYATDAAKYKRDISPSHSFEHLSCFFPGLLALGVHLLPLDHLDTLGINVTALADDLLPDDRRAYANLADFDLADLHLWAAEGIAETCYMMYADQPTGLSPEAIRMQVDSEEGEIRWMDALRGWKASQGRDGGSWWGAVSGLLGRGEPRSSPPGVGDMTPWRSPLEEDVTVEEVERKERSKKRPNADAFFGRDYSVKHTAYFLRPETVESFYILWRTTGDAKWRHRGWQIFQSIEHHTRTDSGYASVEGVDTAHPRQLDSMPSYFLAETLKYLYLLFLDDDPLPLDKWVFTTEAHPLPVFKWTAEERASYGIL